MRAKYLEILEMLRLRILRGDYRLDGFPGEQTLAEEVGVSYMTARRAVLSLIEQGYLKREFNGRISLPEQQGKTPPVVALLLPSIVSNIYWDWYMALSELVEAMGGYVRLINYSDFNDRFFFDTVARNYYGIFIANQEELPRLNLDLLCKHRSRVVTLCNDYSRHGLACVGNTPVHGVQHLIKTEIAKGHRNIGCLNVIGSSQLVSDNISQWQAAVKAAGIEGRLYQQQDDHTTIPEDAAYKLTREILAAKDRPTSIFCTSVAPANGVLRAAADAGIRPGRDISLVFYGSNRRARLFNPSLTCLRTEDKRISLDKALKWLSTDKRDFDNPIIFKPTKVRILEGESSCPTLAKIAPKKTKSTQSAFT